MKIYLRLLQYLRPYLWPYFSMAMVCMLGFSATSGVMPFLVQRVFDDVFARKDQVVLVYLPFVIIGVFAFRGFMNFGQSYLTDYVSLRIINDLRNALHYHLQYLSLSFFHRHTTGTLITRVNSDVGLVRSALTDSAASLMRWRSQASSAFCRSSRTAASGVV
jgi:subfamily B ATP-binding cassette protein MsbA